jgi:hypothetical protein
VTNSASNTSCNGSEESLDEASFAMARKSRTCSGRTSVYQTCCKPSILLRATLDTTSDWFLACAISFRVGFWSAHASSRRFWKNPKAGRGASQPGSNSRNERLTLETACPQAVRYIYEMPAKRISLFVAAPLSRDENDVNTNHDSPITYFVRDATTVAVKGVVPAWGGAWV